VSTLAIILIAFAALLLLLFVGGFIASERRQKAREAHLREQLEAADRALAQARADDRGWDLELLQSAARTAYAQRTGGREPEDMLLVQVVDMPGTDNDEAVLRCVGGDGEHDVTLGREAGEWVAR
jgi:type VI protein secretion system component VasK